MIMPVRLVTASSKCKQQRSLRYAVVQHIMLAMQISGQVLPCKLYGWNDRLLSKQFKEAIRVGIDTTAGLCTE